MTLEQTSCRPGTETGGTRQTEWVWRKERFGDAGRPSAEEVPSGVGTRVGQIGFRLPDRSVAGDRADHEIIGSFRGLLVQRRCLVACLRIFRRRYCRLSSAYRDSRAVVADCGPFARCENLERKQERRRSMANELSCLPVGDDGSQPGRVSSASGNPNILPLNDV